jgi:uncharacterized membrane protein SirB2
MRFSVKWGIVVLREILLLFVEAMLYLTLKYLHVTCVILSIGGFCLRGMLLVRKSALAGRHAGWGSEWHGGRTWLRALPHINDSLLLAAAIGLAVVLEQYPFINGWLTAKIFGLLAYILLGALALKPGHDSRVRIVAGLTAVTVFGWIVSVALSKHPAGFLA